jgi:hypothetical protein
MAQAFPRSVFVGSDYHRESIEAARSRAAEAGVGDRVTFEVVPATSFTGGNYSQDLGLALGTQAGPARIRDVATAAGFGRFRPAAATPFNSVLDARP